MIDAVDIGRAQADLAAKGAAVLRGVIMPDDAQRMLDEVRPALPLAFSKVKEHNAYLVADDPQYPPDHPRNRKTRTTSATLAYDLVPEGALRRLYLRPDLVGTIARILGHDALYPYADPLAGLNVLQYKPGAELAWHFDSANFVVTLMLQPAESGGSYQYFPFSRNESDEGFEIVARAQAEDLEGVEILEQEPGDLVIFQGKNTLHRVSEVKGGKDRVIAVFSYDASPGKTLHEDTRRTFYGRAA